MKFLVLSELANLSEDEQLKILRMYAEHGAPAGTEGLWVTADGQYVVGIYELDDMTEMSKLNNLYRPAFEAGGTRWFPLIDAETAVEHQTAAAEQRKAAT